MLSILSKKSVLQRASASTIRSFSLRPKIKTSFNLKNESYDNQKIRDPTRPSVVTFAKGKKGGAASEKESGKGKGKGGKGGKGASDEDVDVDAIEAQAKSDAESRMQKALVVLGDNCNTLRTGRANPAILDKIMVEYYGAPTPLKQVASVTVPDSSTLQVTPFDTSVMKDLNRAIQESDLGINPSNDGERIRLNIPPLTQERRKDLVKQVSKYSEESKVAVRNVRKDVMKTIDKHGDAFGKDARKDLENEIQKLTDAYCKKVEEVIKAKSEELMKV